MSAAKHKFGGFYFTDSEVDQLCWLYREICAGALKVDLRKLSGGVKKFVFFWGILKRADGSVDINSRVGWQDLPIEAVWRIVKPAFKGERSKGRSIARSEVWSNLNLFPEGHRHHKPSDLGEMMDCLIRLQSFGYVWAQFGGSVWEITIV
jgi:hypothetical protein